MVGCRGVVRQAASQLVFPVACYPHHLHPQNATSRLRGDLCKATGKTLLAARGLLCHLLLGGLLCRLLHRLLCHLLGGLLYCFLHRLFYCLSYSLFYCLLYCFLRRRAFSSSLLFCWHRKERIMYSNQRRRPKKLCAVVIHVLSIIKQLQTMHLYSHACG